MKVHMQWHGLGLKTCAVAAGLTLSVAVHMSVRAQPQLSDDKDPRRAEIVQGLVAVITAPENTGFHHLRWVSPSETGRSYALGLRVFSRKLIFKSGYQNISPWEMAKWAYALHQYLVSVGGGWENYVASLREERKHVDPPITDLSELAVIAAGGEAGAMHLSRRFLNGTPTIDESARVKATARIQVPYAAQYEFAKEYWEPNCDSYGQAPDKDLWLHDAILDGNNIYFIYLGEPSGPFAWELLDHLNRKK